METLLISIVGGALVAALGWKAAYWMGRTRGYEDGKAEATEHAFADATDLMETLLAAQEAWRAAAQAELDFLISLLPEGEKP